MTIEQKTVIKIEATIDAPVDKVWETWVNPEDVKNWNAASDDWQTSAASNDLKIGGKFNYRMEAKDGSAGFDFWGIYDDIVENENIFYTMGDQRKVWLTFHEMGDATHLVEEFEAEDQNSLKMQREGWQAILDRFANYVEAKLAS